MKPNLEIRKRFAANLRKRRLALPMEPGDVRTATLYPVSQKRLAERVGVSLKQYTNWECMKEGATLDSAERVALYYTKLEGKRVTVGDLCA